MVGMMCSMIKRILRYLPPESDNVSIMKDLMTELGNCLRKMQIPFSVCKKQEHGTATH